MERGAEHSVAIAVLGVIGIVGVLATVTLLQKPTGLVMQDQSIYVTEDAGRLAITCKNVKQEVVFLGYEANYEAYCCLEDMIGQNECRFPHKVLMTRKY
jgi:hypothetical protein